MVALVGAGPGDAGLITVKGEKLIKEADCIIYDRLIGSELLDLAKESCEKIYVGKENHNHTLIQDEINKLILEKSQQYKLVVRLKGGDPYVFGRGGEEALFLIENGADVCVVPGITSAIAVPAYAGIPVTHRGISKGFHVITSHSSKDELSEIDFSLLTNEDETCIFLMGLKHVGQIAARLIEAGRPKDTKTCVISNGTGVRQRKCIGTLENIDSLVKEAGLTSPSVIVVGEVVGLESELSLFEHRPLWGRKLLLPYIAGGEFSFSEGWRSTHDNPLAGMLSDLGAEVVRYETGRIVPVRVSAEEMAFGKKNDILIFTSKNAVYAFMWNLAENGMDLRDVGNAKIAAVGEKTGQVLKSFGIKADIVSEKGTSDDLADILLKEAAGKRIVWFCAKVTGGNLESKLNNTCELKKTVCYKNDPFSAEMSVSDNGDYNNCDGSVFTSASNVRRFHSAIGETDPGIIFSIGPESSKAVKEIFGMECIECDHPSYSNLADKITETFKRL